MKSDLSPVEGVTTQVDKIKAHVEQIKAAADKQALASIYLDLIGYDPFEDEPSNTAEEVRAVLLDFVRELCFASGVQCADVGL